MKPGEFAAKLNPGAFVAKRERLMQRILFIAQAKSQAVTPVLTGTLRRSETTKVEKTGTIGILGTNIVYAPFVHARVPFFVMGIQQGASAIQGEVNKFGDDLVNSWA